MERPSRTERAFAAAYDPLMFLAERGPLGVLRGRLLNDLAGHVLEVGAGTGANLAHYGPAAELTLCEPSEPMRTRLVRRAHSLGMNPTVSDAPAESLPARDRSVDTVVATLVLCTAADPVRALAEIRRVLAPGGELVLLEHVRGHTWHGRFQDAVAPLWSALAGGCRPNQDTASLVERAGFEWVDVRRLTTPLPVVSPLLAGRARACCSPPN